MEDDLVGDQRLDLADVAIPQLQPAFHDVLRLTISTTLRKSMDGRGHAELE